MFIEPNTNIRLLHNVPLDNTYQHTIYFSSKTDQYDYFVGCQKYNLTRNTYQRVQKGVARVGIVADNLYDCNYMMFQNTNFGDKWFYAFINNVEYVNNITSEITFQIDVMQTWFFDYNRKVSYVEREHVSDDTIGLHIEPEPVDTGEYVMNDYSPIIQMTDMAVVVAVVDTAGETTNATLYDGIYGGAFLYVYNSSDTSSIASLITNYIQKPESIIGIYILPKILLNNQIPSTHLIPYGATGNVNIVEKTACSTSMTIDGYKPHNNKLYTYPYNFYHIDNASGSDLSLRYEFFDGLKPVFEICGTVTQPVQVSLRPCSYKGVPSYTELGGYTTLNTECITLTDYPMCSWNYDSYRAWISQNYIPLGLNLLSSSTNLTRKLDKRKITPFNAETQLIDNVASAASTMYQASIASDVIRGSVSNGNGNVANHKQQFYGGQCSITHQQALVIDNFFDMFGYAINRKKVPNITSRPHWNYIKTVGCCLTGSVPADDMRTICNIYDNGITFWKKGDEVGHYNLDNTLS